MARMQKNAKGSTNTSTRGDESSNHGRDDGRRYRNAEGSTNTSDPISGPDESSDHGSNDGRRYRNAPIPRRKRRKTDDGALPPKDKESTTASRAKQAIVLAKKEAQSEGASKTGWTKTHVKKAQGGKQVASPASSLCG